MVSLLVTAVLMLVVGLGPVLAYEGITPEPYRTPNLGSASNICPSHPDLWVTAVLWVSGPASYTNQTRFASQCVYCEGSGIADCKDEKFVMPILEPDRRWLFKAGGPCPPGVAADVNASVIRGNYYDNEALRFYPYLGWNVTGPAGCNAGPDMPDPTIGSPE